MSEELRARREHVEERIKKLIDPLDESIKALHNEMLATDPSEDLNELQQIERLEGFHDYLVLSEVANIEHPTLEDFDRFKLDNPDALLSFGSGEHREPLESDELEVEDTVSDEVLEESDADNAVQDEELEEARATNEGMPMNPSSEPEIVTPVGVTNEDEDELKSAGWAKEKSVDETESSPVNDSSSEKEEVEIENEKESDESQNDENERIPGRIDAKAVSEKTFERKRGGYSEDEVDRVLDEVILFFDEDHSTEEYESKIKELSIIEFRKPIFAQGLNPSEVDGFISAIIAELKNRSANNEK